ncbi:MAG: peptidase MA family metallohydrolase [Dehalococcoidia bacterium]
MEVRGRGRLSPRGPGLSALVRAASPLAVAVVALFALLASPRVAARAQQSAIVVQSDQAENDFPAGVTFRLTFSAPSPPKEVRVNYTLAPDGTAATAIAQCSGTTTVSCSYALASGNGIVIIPGAHITYHWEISDTGGDRLVTPDKLYVHQDTRFTFKTLTQGNVTLYYYAGTQSAAQAVLDAAVQTIRTVGALEQTQVTFPVKVFLYQTAQEMQPAIAPGSINPGVTILGEVVYSDTAMVSADIDTLDITRHEVAHIVTGQATKGPYGLPAWLNEGISVASQQQVLGSQKDALDAAIRADRVLSITQLSSSLAGSSADTVSLFYGESGAIVKHLIDVHGAAKFAELLRTFKDGSTPDDAFRKVYGFDQLGLENEWRQSVGLPARTAAATPAPSSTSRAVGQATPIPGAGVAAPSGSRGSGGANGLVIAVIAALGALVALAGFGAYTTLRRRL